MRVLKRKRDEIEEAELDAKLEAQSRKVMEQSLKSLKIDDQLKEYTLTAARKEEHDLIAHKKRMEESGGELILVRTNLVSNPEIRRLMDSDAHIQSVFNDYLKQSMMHLVYNGPAAATSEEAKKAHDYCPDFVALCQQMGYGIPSRAKLIVMGKHAARMFREAYGQEPATTIKYVNGANRSVKTYRLKHLKWLKDRVRDTMTTP